MVEISLNLGESLTSSIFRAEECVKQSQKCKNKQKYVDINIF
jgi:hypothetical protein